MLRGACGCAHMRARVRMHICMHVSCACGFACGCTCGLAYVRMSLRVCACAYMITILYYICGSSVCVRVRACGARWRRCGCACVCVYKSCMIIILYYICGLSVSVRVWVYVCADTYVRTCMRTYMRTCLRAHECMRVRT